MVYIAALENALGKKLEMDMLSLLLCDLPDAYAAITDLVKPLYYKPATHLDKFVKCLLDRRCE